MGHERLGIDFFFLNKIFPSNKLSKIKIFPKFKTELFLPVSFMAGYEPPSFSLGLDLGLDSEPQIAPDKHPTQTPAPHDEDLGPEVMDLNPES